MTSLPEVPMTDGAGYEPVQTDDGAGYVQTDDGSEDNESESDGSGYLTADESPEEYESPGQGLLRGTQDTARYDQLHSNPPGPSLHIPFAGGGVLSFDKDPQTLSETQPNVRETIWNNVGAMGNAPDVPDSVRNAPTGVSALEALGRAYPGSQPYWNQQDERDKAIAQDAAALHGQIPARDPAMLVNTDAVLAGVNSKMDGARALLGQHDGIVIAGGHGENTAWDFLTNNMRDLYDAGVRTIYTESLRDDGHQDMVNEYLRGGQMDEGLDTFLTLNPPGLRNTLEAARNTGMHVQGFGGWPARRPVTAGQEVAAHTRAALVNTYGSQVVQHYQEANPGKYVMEIGAAHAITHPGPPDGATVQGVTIPPDFPGVGDILNVPVVRTDPANSGRFSQLRDVNKPLPDPPIGQTGQGLPVTQETQVDPSITGEANLAAGAATQTDQFDAQAQNQFDPQAQNQFDPQAQNQFDPQAQNQFDPQAQNQFDPQAQNPLGLASQPLMEGELSPEPVE